ncbi:hypothetical protein [Thermococcus sp.]|jgi:hypothetical protein|nr:hypothetical protein [Thermococcus sp.]
MKWELTLHGGTHHGERIVFDAESIETARKKAFEELKSKNAMVFELEKLE